MLSVGVLLGLLSLESAADNVARPNEGFRLAPQAVIAGAAGRPRLYAYEYRDGDFAGFMDIVYFDYQGSRYQQLRQNLLSFRTLLVTPQDARGVVRIIEASPVMSVMYEFVDGPLFGIKADMIGKWRTADIFRLDGRPTGGTFHIRYQGLVDTDEGAHAFQQKWMSPNQDGRVSVQECITLVDMHFQLLTAACKYDVGKRVTLTRIK